MASRRRRTGPMTPLLCDRHLPRGRSARQAAYLEQLQPQGFEPGDHAVYGGLVAEAAGQQCVLAARRSGERQKRAEHAGPKVAANEDLVIRPSAIALLAGHRAPWWNFGTAHSIFPVLWVSGHRTPCAIRDFPADASC